MVPQSLEDGSWVSRQSEAEAASSAGETSDLLASRAPISREGI